MSLLTRLLLLVLLAVLPAIGIQAYHEYALRQIREAQAHQEALRLARLADAEMDRIAEGARQLLIAFTENPAVSSSDWQSCNEAAERLLARLEGYVNLGIVTPGGDVICAGLPQARGASFTASSSFADAVAAEDFHIGRYDISVSTGAKILCFTEPLRDRDKRKIGFAWVSLDLGWLAAHFADRFSGPDVSLAVADRDGTLLLSLPDPEKWVGRRLDEKYMQFVLAPREGTADFPGVDGMPRIGAYSPVTVAPIGLYVGVALTKTAVFASIDRATIRGAVLVALGLCLALAAAWLGGTAFIRRPINALLRSSERWRRGDYAARSGLTDQRSELGRLGRAFDAMAIEIEQRESETRRADEQLRRFNEMLEQRVAERTRELVEANRRLAIESDERRRAEAALLQAQKIESIGQLTGGVAHDFNNLLTAVLGNLDIAQTRVSDPAVLKLLDGAARAAERGARLTEQLLAFARKQHLQPRAVDINALVAGMGEMLHRSIGATVSIEQTLAQDLWPAMADPIQIELSILNLAINARDAMPLGGRLVIATANSPEGEQNRPEDLVDGDYVMITVSDSGTGMTEQVMARALEPFFTTKERGKGSGLGLSMVFGVAKQSGGGLSLASRPGEGTTVRVYLPRARVPAVVADPHPAGPPEAAALKGLIVLLIDDDPDVREVAATLLGDLECRVIAAESAEAGLAALGQGPGIDLAVVDFAMPDMNGIETADILHGKHPSLPVVIISGFADVDMAALARRQLYFLEKPFQRAKLVATLLRALGRGVAEPGRASSLQSQDSPEEYPPRLVRL